MRKGAKGFAAVLCALLAASAARAERGTVTASALVLREGPGLEFAMLGEIPQGSELEILFFDNGWYNVQYGGQSGYVYARYVRVNLPEGEATPAATPMPEAYAPAAERTTAPGLSLPELTFDGENNPNFPCVLMPGDMGNSVLDLQTTLQNLGYAVSVDGQYGYETQAAVMKLQRDLGLDADGIVGAQTRKMIGNQNPGGVELLDWWLGGNVSYARLTEATVVDARTGRRFKVFRYGGDNHCDAKPLTSQDAQEMLSICGGEWTWECRPVWLEVGGRVIAASMNCMPHDGQHIFANNVDGNFCIHFFNSRTHDIDRIDEEHAACVQEAWDCRFSYSPQ